LSGLIIAARVSTGGVSCACTGKYRIRSRRDATMVLDIGRI
jgi:hypothetical protein